MGIYRVLKILQPCVGLFDGCFVWGTTEDFKGREDSLDVGHLE